MQFWNTLIAVAIQQQSAPGGVVLTGVAGTGAAGSLSPQNSVAITGVSASGAVGSVSASIAYSAALTGVAGSGATGNVGPSNSVSLTGVSGSGAVGSFAAQLSFSLSGVAASGAVGSVSPSTVVALSGVAATGAVGDVSAANDVIVALSGVAGAGAVGDVAAEAPQESGKQGGDDAWRESPHKGPDKKAQAKARKFDADLEQTIRDAWKGLQQAPEPVKAQAVAIAQPVMRRGRQVLPEMEMAQVRQLLALWKQQLQDEEDEDEEILMML